MLFMWLFQVWHAILAVLRDMLLLWVPDQLSTKNLYIRKVEVPRKELDTCDSHKIKKCPVIVKCIVLCRLLAM